MGAVLRLRTRTFLLSLGLLFLATVALVPSTRAFVGQQILPPTSNMWEAAFDWRPVVINTGSGFMMWYSGEDSSGVDNIGLATSDDGITWTRYAQNPVLPVGYSGQWDSGSVNEAWVIQEGGQFKMWYSGQHFDPTTHHLLSYSIGYATSPDGVHWAKYSGNPVFTVAASGSWDDKWVWRPIIIPTGSSYTMYYSAEGTDGYGGAGIAQSTDGIHWTRQQQISLPKETWDAYGWDLTSVTAGVGGYVIAYDGYPTKPSNNIVMGDHRQIGLSTSPDGVRFTADANNPVIVTESGSTAWDSSAVGYPMVLVVGSEYYVYYAAFSGSYYSLALAMIPTSQLQISSTTQAYPTYQSTTTAPAATQSSQSSVLPQPNSTPQLLGVVAVVVVVALIGLFLYSRRNKKPVSAPTISESKTSPKTPSKIYCIECGNLLATGSKFCNKCGTRQP